ncbi:hypothetical protein AB4455_21520 [Vibrio sp. 10N.261.46.E12]|uniref:hypothetical protein n=1 Tax=unclassified Vibrio TaxID=2614977 RepID=UPI0009775D34|nr:MULTISPECIES: hypothetical protein [unclassified Vibrio]OMO37800.1 hypothetical protein BH584_21095 [Vibrio sp. 10N.261.45.E1]PMJ35422.1 hypothetical protein BCU27_02405 [Vibrio sp. 10N.286.45.B6]PML83683.1 hypothetical protein BCT66_18600 [Vibrio sp. 10N.261.49.E11]PMM74897.1 hypothetical protein BCT48_03105 [Vibrio sp. 10N.261.46.F12]PMM79561.1 hypothetical protein BCT46_19860 [Vibrio sp. 10N.261.46.E8]
MKPVLFAFPLALTMLMPSIASAKETCTIEQFQAIDIQPNTKGGVLDKESGQFLVTEKPPMRCANITFTTSTTRNRIASQMNNNFEASFYDNQTGNSHSATFDEDEVKAGYIRIGPNNPAEAYVCFVTSETPIKDITCDVN